MASHAGYRFGCQHYNLTDGTIAQIAARGGVVGLIFAQHQINDGIRRSDTKTLAESLDGPRPPHRGDRPDHVAIGSDLDGFIKPTIGGVETAADLAVRGRAARPSPGVGGPDPERERAAGDQAALRQRSDLTPRMSRHVSPRRARRASAPSRTPGSAARCPCPS